ncbi:hypothetical protein MYX04_08415 [Nitrospiraceae bacterium AH_259_D15_M11_P09]|nr:hypothetical protein [Nitrospiraceae bacterium AH_259_D15_M11_P09]
MPPGQPFVGEGGAGVGSRGGLRGGVRGGWRRLRHSVYRVDCVYSVASVYRVYCVSSVQRRLRERAKGEKRGKGATGAG